MRSLTGATFAQAVLAGALTVHREQRVLDRINVFPVADADTGANLAATLAAAGSRFGETFPSEIGTAARLAADAALDGARGNSGAIFAQFLDGLATGVVGQAQVGPRQFAAAAHRGVEAAYQALQDPREGTILSVLRAWAVDLSAHSLKADDFRVVLDRALAAARSALAHTPRQLEVLARHRVVDAGGQGFVYFLEGMQGFISGRLSVHRQQIQSLVERARSYEPAPSGVVVTDSGTDPRYCTECLVSGARLERASIKQAVSALGESLVVAGTGERLRVHVHTNDPQAVFAVLEEFGTVVERKIDDMVQQQAAAQVATVALVSDSTCDLPEDVYRLLALRRVPLTVVLGSESYLDGVDITPAEFVDLLRRGSQMPTSSQPSPGDFRALYREVLEQREAVLSIHISSGISGTYQAALAAAEQVGRDKVMVVDSKHVSVGLGLVVEAAGDALALGATVQEAAGVALETVGQVRVFGTVRDLEYARRSGRIDKRIAAVAGLAQVKPIVVFTGDGVAHVGGKVIGYGRALKNLVNRTVQFAGDNSVRLMITHAGAPADAEEVRGMLLEAFPEVDIPLVQAGPVLTAHVGPGCVTVAVRRLPPASAF